MANVSLKTDFKDGDKLYDYQLNNNFKAIKAALEAMNKIVWQDDETNLTGITAFKGDSDEIEARELIDGQLLYNIETGETYIDAYVDNVLKRLNTGSGNVVAIQPEEPTNDAVKLWIDTDDIDATGSELVDAYSEDPTKGYNTTYVNGDILYDSESGTAGDVSLSKSISNYSILKVTYGGNNRGKQVATLIASSSANWLVSYTVEGNAPYVYITKITLSGSTISIAGYSRGSFIEQIADENFNTIYRVVGCK